MNNSLQQAKTMNPLSLAWLWLVFTGCVICSPAKQFSSEVKSFDIPRVIDSIYQFYQNRETYRQICWKRRESLITELNLKGYDDIWIELSRFVHRMKELRTFLLMEDMVEKDVENNIKDSFVFVMISVFTMKDVIGDLRPRFIEWKRQGIRDIKEDPPFQWFNYHRFTKEMLKDVEIRDLEEIVEDMYKEDVFSKKLLKFVGTILFLKPTCHPFNALPWLATLHNNVKMVEIVENYFKANEEMIPLFLYTEILDLYCQYRSERSIFRILFDLYNKREVYSLYMNIYSHASIEAEHADLCINRVEEMHKELNRNPSYDELRINVEKPGASLNRYLIPGFTFPRKLGSDEAASEDKPPRSDGPSSAMEQSVLNDEEELGFVGLNRLSKEEEHISDSDDGLDYSRDTAHSRRGRSLLKSTAYGASNMSLRATFFVYVLSLI